MIRLAGVVLIALLLSASAQAQTEDSGNEDAGGLTAEDVNSFLPRITAETQEGTSGGLDLLPSVPCESVSDPQVAERCVAALFAYYDYYTFGLAHRQRVIWWQHISSRIIFAIVLGLVVVGVYFAWRQFSATLSGGGAGDQPSSTVEIGSQGVKVSSPVLGVIILTLSLGFFYLYLVFVYPIVEII